MRRAKLQTVAGQRLPPPRPTVVGVLVVLGHTIVPVLVIGGLLDLGMQVGFGVCTGLWCLAQP